MSNPTMVSFLAILVILATAVWRTVTGRASDGYRTIWAAGLVSIGLGFLTDLSAPTGAAISFAVLLFFILRLRNQPKSGGKWTPPTPNGSAAGQVAAPSTNSGGTSNTPPKHLPPPTSIA